MVSDARGHIFEIPGLEMVGRQLLFAGRLEQEDIIPLPFGSALFHLPDRHPLAYDPRKRRIITLRQYEGREVFAVGGFMAPAYTQTHLAAYETHAGAVRLPLFAYSAVGWQRNDFCVSGFRVDADVRQDPALFNQDLIERQAQSMLQRHPQNRLVAHVVEKCVRCYGCPAAQNFVLGRWEAPLPTSPICNARCVGCISKQPEQGVAVTQDRLAFVPTPEEIAEMAVPHLEEAPRPIVSFGQGCEGEPLLQGDTLERAIRLIRQRTGKGTINLNTNASRPDVVERLCQAGLDSIRVSLNSAQPHFYEAYYQPRGYGWEEVCASLRSVRSFGRWISLNYFIFPGFTDQPEEMDALQRLIDGYHIDYIQMRNLNIDPERYIEALDLKRYREPGMGIRAWQRQMQRAHPWLRFGYFNPPREDWTAAHQK